MTIPPHVFNAFIRLIIGFCVNEASDSATPIKQSPSGKRPISARIGAASWEN